MPIYKNFNQNPDHPPRFEVPYSDIIRSVPVGGALQVLKPLKYLSARQIAWWKGIFLPALSKDNGESIACWENRLKFEVLPDDFRPVVTWFGREKFKQIPSVTTLSVTRMTLLMKGSVQHLREDPKYGNHYQWVTLPDSALRKK